MGIRQHTLFNIFIGGVLVGQASVNWRDYIIGSED
jgi:hypothetical protein